MTKGATGVIISVALFFNPKPRGIVMQEQKEQWRDIPTLEGKYQASNKGRIRSVDRTVVSNLKDGKTVNRKLKSVLLSQSLRHANSKAYLCVDIKGSTTSVHRLVLMAWDRMPKKGEIALHWDDDPLNNNIENLRWGSHSDNMVDAFRNSGSRNKGEKHGMSELTDEKVLEMRQKRSDGVSINDLAKEYGVAKGTASNAISGISWSHLPNAVNDVGRGGYAKLTDEQKEEVLKEYKAGMSGVEIAKKWNVSRGYASQLMRKLDKN